MERTRQAVSAQLAAMGVARFELGVFMRAPSIEAVTARLSRLPPGSDTGREGGGGERTRARWLPSIASRPSASPTGRLAVISPGWIGRWPGIWPGRDTHPR